MRKIRLDKKVEKIVEDSLKSKSDFKPKKSSVWKAASDHVRQAVICLHEANDLLTIYGKEPRVSGQASMTYVMALLLEQSMTAWIPTKRGKQKR